MNGALHSYACSQLRLFTVTPVHSYACSQLRLLEYAAVTAPAYDAAQHGPSTIYVRDTLSSQRREASRHRAALLENKRRNEEKRHAVGAMRRMRWPDGRVRRHNNTNRPRPSAPRI